VAQERLDNIVHVAEASTTTCTRCGQLYAASMASCPACKAPNPTPVADLALQARLAEAPLEAHAMELRASRTLRVVTLVLFAFSLLTVVPALLVMRLMAKRWGRVDFVLIAVDIVILTLASYGTRMFWPVAISAVSSVAVYVLRYRHLERGIALGYSDAVITPAMISGALLLGTALYLGLSGSVSAHLDRVLPRSLDAEALHRLPEGAVASVVPGEIRWDEALRCGTRCTAVEPRPLSASEISSRREELLGSRVVLAESAPLSPTFVREGLGYRLDGDGSDADHRDRRRLVHGVATRTVGRDAVWVAAPSGTATRDGLLVYAVSDAAFARRWSAERGSQPLQVLALTVLVGAETDAARATERWAPLDAEGRVWVAVPEGASTLPTATGVIRAREPARAALVGARAPVPEVVTVIAVGLEAPPAPPPLLGGVTLGVLALLLLALVLGALSLRFAWHET
jgi:hypothetical protein